MRKISADYIFPITSPPMKNGVVITDDYGKILDLLPCSPLGEDEVNRYNGIICPGFVNTHCHLELSYLKNEIPEKTGLPEFIKYIEQLKKKSFTKAKKMQAMRDAENEMIENGIVAVGDISNTDLSFFQKSKNRLKYHTFIETLGFQPGKAKQAFQYSLALFHHLISFKVNASVSPHSPYSISQELFKKIIDFGEKNNSILSMHNQESEDENKMFLMGDGKILEAIKWLGIDTSFWKPTKKKSLQTVLPYFSKNNKLQLVHNTFTSREDIQFANLFFNPELPTLDSKLFWCFCPNANLFIENKLPDFNNFIEENCTITIGTDSLASNKQLSVLEELKVISSDSPHISLEKLLQWSTLNGAQFLGFDNVLGSIEVGKTPGLNLIQEVNLTELKLNVSSNVRKL